MFAQELGLRALLMTGLAALGIMVVPKWSNVLHGGPVTIVHSSSSGQLLWPIPREGNMAGDPVPLAPGFSFVTNCTSPTLKQNIRRYNDIINRTSPQNSRNEDGLKTVEIQVWGSDESLNENTDQTYQIAVLYSDKKTASIRAQTIHGALYGMETFSQLINAEGMLAYGVVVVHDAPEYKHRGLMLDSGRRFFPVSTVKNVLDGMQYSKLNVLHWHLSDFCRFAVQSDKFPELSAGLTGDLAGYYTKAEVQEVIEYARVRGIRVVPEFDLPGHALGMRFLAKSGMQFCADNIKRQIYDDPEGRSASILKELLGEMAGLFPDRYMHIGCDETSVVGDCTIDNIAGLERKVIGHLQGLNKTVVGWEEVLLVSKAANARTVINSWRGAGPKNPTSQGYKVVESNCHRFYWDVLANKLDGVWWDIGANLTPQERKLLIGGESSMWTDNYCYVEQCGAWGTTKTPEASSFFPPSQDALFSKSVGGLIWPRAGVAAGAFWRYSPDLPPGSEEFRNYYTTHTNRLIARGVEACPPDCECDYLSRCGVKYGGQ
eukprot:comp22576_c0_seq1/m.34484 comp22576_c0_seq1/g.34484  ORF comp22576_c0_seq1/g.34484 comp22576_c0_seq1/m.34484 type:complete len:545 (-) comp22576_c0_seq1:657-2291(-)